MKVNIFDVAKRSGLSVVTVSRVLNQSSTVRQKNKEKVLKAMEELNYQPNASARSLARGKTGIVGLSLSNLGDSFFDGVVKETNERLREQGYLLALSISRSSGDAFRRSLFQEDRVDGVILLSPTEEDDYLLELKNNKIPHVLIDNSKNHPSASSVIVDNFKGGYEAAKHLIELGHTEIAHISGPDPFLSSRERERGFLAALGEAGLQPYRVERGTFELSSGYEIATRWIDSDTLPSALFAADDYIALGVVDACLNRGIRIPERLSIVGFDDQKLASEFRPLLTTVRQPADKIGAAAVELLLETMADPAKRKKTVRIGPTLIVRESTARKPT
ncbi:LacI family DNA-binding transcriptional regulator [Cohnella hongkongensis]|uniref:LacI family DNA-binding transcriptional regulator n=1 Tax=Cohnella hongkongensis TaxID=178337 RepID=A0ABV9FAR7_9BACL